MPERGDGFVIYDAIQITTTAANRGDLERIARQVVGEGLAACAQIDGPILSVYRWKGQVETAEEWRCTLKSLASVEAELMGAIEELHPYEVPEIITVAIPSGSQAYFDWMAEQIRIRP